MTPWSMEMMPKVDDVGVKLSTFGMALPILVLTPVNFWRGFGRRRDGYQPENTCEAGPPNHHDDKVDSDQ